MPRRSLDDRLDLLGDVASMYFEDSLSQAEIAQRIGFSRSYTSRLINEAIRRGVVQIRVSRRLRTSTACKNALVKRFALADARVLRAGPVRDYRLKQKLGMLASRFLEGLNLDGATVGISSGSTLQAMIDATSSLKRRDVEVVQITGGLGGLNPDLEGLELARRLAVLLGASLHYLHAPTVVENRATRDALLCEPSVRDVLEKGRNAGVLFVGIGTPDPGLSSLYEAGHLGMEELATLRSNGAVGDICARHFDIRGTSCALELNERIIGLGLDDLRGAACVVGVAGGKGKANAVLGALRGQLLDVLITDEGLANEVLAATAEQL